MTLWTHCLAAATVAACAAFVSANAQTRVQGVIQPAAPASSASPASKPVIHSVPLNPSAPASESAQKPAENPAAKAPERRAERSSHRRTRRRGHESSHRGTSQGSEPAPPILPEQPGAQPSPQPTPGAQPYVQPGPPAAPITTPSPQPSPPPSVQAAPPPPQPLNQPAVSWTLQVIRDGQLIDTFEDTTAIGQGRSYTHHKVVTHHVGCEGRFAGSIDLQRTITVAPQRANPGEAVLAIDADETVESDSASKTRAGCTLPPQPSEVHANHAGLIVPAGQWVNWQIVRQDPSLMYRVRASFVPPQQQ